MFIYKATARQLYKGGNSKPYMTALIHQSIQ